jgi:hypothetical protein
VVFQKPPQRPIDIYDAAAFAKIWFPLLHGEILHLRIPVGSTPLPNKEEEENARRLSSLPKPFDTTMEFGLKSQDGFLFWNRPIKMARSSGDDIVEEIVVEGGRGAPLEVGATEGSRTAMHFVEYGCLARWPYDQDYITVLWRHPNPGPKNVTCDEERSNQAPEPTAPSGRGSS